jgi:hypothetical protein
MVLDNERQREIILAFFAAASCKCDDSMDEVYEVRKSVKDATVEVGEERIDG